MQPEQTLQIIDTTALVAEAGHQGPIWSLSTPDLNLNLISWSAGHLVEKHTNREVDVLGIVVAGAATLIVEDDEHHLKPGMAFVIPKGKARSMQAGDNGFAYLSCHRRRAGLMPEFKKS